MPLLHVEADAFLRLAECSSDRIYDFFLRE